MGHRRNKLRNAASLIGLSFFRHENRIVEIAKIGSRTRSENQFLYAKVQFILVPPHPRFQLVPPHNVCSGDGTARQQNKPKTNKQKFKLIKQIKMCADSKR